tara:strand:+ start:2018 stop:2233 length:216 start_codon:yes stop_codon:yes gene_type:complete
MSFEEAWSVVKKEPLVIEKHIWDEFYRVQQSGKMNMMGHPYVIYFMEGDNWQRAYDHFEDQGNTEPLTIEK